MNAHRKPTTEEIEEVQGEDENSEMRPNPAGEDQKSGEGVVYKNYRDLTEDEKGSFDKKLFPQDGRGASPVKNPPSKSRKQLHPTLQEKRGE